MLFSYAGRRGSHKFVQEDVDVLSAQELHEVLSPNTLAPVATGAAAESVGQPEGLVVVPVRAGGAAAVVTVLQS